MKTEQDDLDLRSRFHELREYVESSTPPFAVKPTIAKRPRPVIFAVAAAGPAAAVVVIVWTSVVGDGMEILPLVDMSTVAWAAPTDYLLETPGRDFLRNLPTFGVSEFALQSGNPEGGVADTSS